MRHGTGGTPASTVGADVLAQLTPDQLFDALAVRVDGPRCWHEHLVLELDLTDTGARYRLELRNGVLTHTVAAPGARADAVLHLPAAALPRIAGTVADPAALTAAGVVVDGDVGAVGRLLAALEAPDPGFAIVTP
ncbi:alkyl sulfatase C-terminal domain-containing protein [Kocuria turfanensis]|uniref:alkyl sulfatase C-terminal domain-containing protein n=1 Tax=Kocuria turfanensis TaxID=388357 RepID=UPI0021C09EF2|nr:alkyl sulfatase C-terminal domain-containing protein [Kocuria turfanensis]